MFEHINGIEILYNDHIGCNLTDFPCWSNCLNKCRQSIYKILSPISENKRIWLSAVPHTRSPQSLLRSCKQRKRRNENDMSGTYLVPCHVLPKYYSSYIISYISQAQSRIRRKGKSTLYWSVFSFLLQLLVRLLRVGCVLPIARWE